MLGGAHSRVPCLGLSRQSWDKMQYSNSDFQLSLWKHAGQFSSVWNALCYSQWLPAVRGVFKIMQHLSTSKWLLLSLAWSSLSLGSPDFVCLACHHLSWLLFFFVSSSCGCASFSYIEIVNRSSSVHVNEKFTEESLQVCWKSISYKPIEESQNYWKKSMLPLLLYYIYYTVYTCCN